MRLYYKTCYIFFDRITLLLPLSYTQFHFFCRGAVSFHRKSLGRFRNPYTNLTAYKDRPVAVATPRSSPVPSRTPVTSKSSPLPPPQKSPPAQDVSAPPPFVVPFANFPSLRKTSKTSSNSIVPIVAGCVGGAVFLVLLATGVFFFKSKAGKSVNPWRTGLSGQLQKAFITGNFFSTH